MGVIYKLKPEIKDFILAQKSDNPTLSCRKLTNLVLDNFKIELSKSSINMIIKEAGLSAPIGRTPKKKKQRIAMPRLPILLEDTSAKEAEAARQAEKEKWQKLAEEERRRQEEIRQTEEEKTRKAEEARLAQEAKQKAEAEAARRSEEEKLKAEAEAKAEAEKRAKEEAEKEALRKKEDAQKEALRKQEEERSAKEAAEKARLAQEEIERKAKEATEKLRLEKLEEEQKRQEEELKKSEEEKLKAAAEATKKAEEERKAKEEAEKEALRKKEEEGLAKEAEEKARKPEEEQAVPAQAEGVKVATAFDAEIFPQIENTGIILLKAADTIIGASQRIAAVIKSRLGLSDGNFNSVIEDLIYLPLLKEKIAQPLLNKLSACLKEIENVKVMNLDILRIMTLSLQEVRCLRFILSDGENVYLDGQMYSVWSSPHIPYDFVSPIHNLKKYINKYFNEGQPLVLFNAPGYDMPSAEFFSFLSAFEAQSSSINNMVLYGNKFNELEVIPMGAAKKRFFIFGVWPWQFIECRKVKSIGQFRPLHLEAQNSDCYIADIEMALSHPRLGKQISLSGCAVKTSLSEKTRLVILSNIPPGDKSSEALAVTYLDHWPNLDEAFQDFSHKIELSTYAANSQRFFSAEKLNPQLDHVLSVEELLRNYLLALDAYVRWYLLPVGYADKELALIKERFYDLEAQSTKSNENCAVNFVLPPEYAFGKDLGYLCHRINEKEIAFPDGLKLYFK